MNSLANKDLSKKISLIYVTLVIICTFVKRLWLFEIGDVLLKTCLKKWFFVAIYFKFCITEISVYDIA